MGTHDHDGMGALSFVAGGHPFFIDASYVHEVRLLSGLTPVPGSPAHLLGIVEVRGYFVPVFDMVTKGGYRRPLRSEDRQLIVFGERGPEMAVLVDAAPEYVRFDPGDKDSWKGGAEEGATWIEGDIFLADKWFFL